MKYNFFKWLLPNQAPISAFAQTFPSYYAWSKEEKEFHRMLEQLNKSSSDEFVQKLIHLLISIPFSSNTTDFFLHYFPIVSHILFYKPEREEKLLHLLVGPIFADSTTEVNEVIEMISRSKDYHLQKNPNFLTKEGIEWVEKTMPTLYEAIQRETVGCARGASFYTQIITLFVLFFQ